MIDKYKQEIKKYLCKRWSVPYNRYGIPNPLFERLTEGGSLTLIDIGAHNGYFSESISKYCDITKGIIIEPLPEKYAILKNKFKPPHYEVVDYIISDKNGVVDFEVNELTETSSILHIKSDIPEHANLNLKVTGKMARQSKTLDSLVRELSLEKIDLLKIDVQGAELLVLIGSNHVLSRTRMIWIEVSFKPLYDNSATFFDIYSYLNDRNFRLIGMNPVFHGPDGELLQCDALFMRRY